jgi:hypothetical protein
MKDFGKENRQAFLEASRPVQKRDSAWVEILAALGLLGATMFFIAWAIEVL